MFLVCHLKTTGYFEEALIVYRTHFLYSQQRGLSELWGARVHFIRFWSLPSCMHNISNVIPKTLAMRQKNMCTPSWHGRDTQDGLSLHKINTKEVIIINMIEHVLMCESVIAIIHLHKIYDINEHWQSSSKLSDHASCQHISDNMVLSYCHFISLNLYNTKIIPVNIWMVRGNCVIMQY